jgi:hypothetical protein
MIIQCTSLKLPAQQKKRLAHHGECPFWRFYLKCDEIPQRPARQSAVGAVVDMNDKCA